MSIIVNRVAFRDGSGVPFQKGVHEVVAVFIRKDGWVAGVASHADVEGVRKLWENEWVCEMNVDENNLQENHIL